MHTDEEALLVYVHDDTFCLVLPTQHRLIVLLCTHHCVVIGDGKPGKVFRRLDELIQIDMLETAKRLDDIPYHQYE